ncbi:hypothetical protein PIB30_096819 [Stylosanthes scabra]|uniref:Uncharacterized protein n=1 Tax=Stylosanthes scabra TaxID=79078 RepID=A0ABU6RW43_9FABA|nr:hypothetical protein [Stylosanthes scabra]
MLWRASPHIFLCVDLLIFFQLLLLQVQDQCSFFQWAYTDLDPLTLELSKYKRKVGLLKLRAIAAAWRLKALIIFGKLDWFLFIVIWFRWGVSCLSLHPFLPN